MELGRLFGFFWKNKNLSTQSVSNNDLSPNKDESTYLNDTIIVNDKQRDYICKKYENYIYHFKELQRSGDYAPIAVFEKTNREINATAFLVKDNIIEISVEYVLNYWNDSFNKKILHDEIISFIMLYHVQVFPEGKKFVIADNVEYANAVALYFKDKDINLNGTIILPYS